MELDGAYLPAAVAIVSDISDMLQYCQLHMKEEILYLAATYERLAEIVNVPATYESMGICADAMGMGWIIDDKNKIYWHNGGTGEFNSYLGFDKERQIGVVILSNVGPNYRIPATVMGVKLMRDLQRE